MRIGSENADHFAQTSGCRECRTKSSPAGPFRDRSEPGPFFRIISVIAARLIDRFENGGMHHAAAADFDPLFSALQRTRFHVNLKNSFGKGKIMRAKTNRRVRTEKFAEEKFQRSFSNRRR